MISFRLRRSSGEPYEMGRATESRTVRVEIDRAFQEEHDRKLDMFKFQEHDAIEKRMPTMNSRRRETPYLPIMMCLRLRRRP